MAFDIYTFERRPGEYVGSHFRSEDGGRTFSGPWESVVFVNRVAATEYPTPEHLRRLKEHGPCPIHRKTFAPVRELLEPSLF